MPVNRQKQRAKIDPNRKRPANADNCCVRDTVTERDPSESGWKGVDALRLSALPRALRFSCQQAWIGNSVRKCRRCRRVSLSPAKAQSTSAIQSGRIKCRTGFLLLPRELRLPRPRRLSQSPLRPWRRCGSPAAPAPGAKPAQQHPATRADVVKQSEASFQKVDTNHDGALSKAEIDAAQGRAQQQARPPSSSG